MSAPALVQSASAFQSAGGSATITATYANTQNAGDLLIACITSLQGGTIPTVTSVTDTKGNVWHRAPATENGVAGGNGVNLEVWYAFNCNAAAAGVNVVTATYSASNSQYSNIVIHEFSGMGPAAPIVTAASFTGTVNNTTMTSGTVTAPSNGAGFCLGVFTCGGGWSAVAGGFTLGTSTSDGGTGTEYEVFTAGGTFTPTATQTPTAQWWALTVAFSIQSAANDPRQLIAPNRDGIRIDYTPGPYGYFTPAPSSALVGEADGVGGASGTLTGSGALSGTAAGVGGATSTLIGAGALSGEADGVGGASGTLFNASPGPGYNPAYVSAPNRTGPWIAFVPPPLSSASLIKFIIGEADGVGGASGTLTGAGALSGEADGVGGASATLTGVGALSGTAAGVGGASGTVTGAAALAGGAAGAGGASGTLTGAGALNGTAAGVGGASGTLTGAGALNGEADGVGGASAYVLLPNVGNDPTRWQAPNRQGAQQTFRLGPYSKINALTLLMTAEADGVGGASATLTGAGALSGTAAGLGGASSTPSGAGALSGTAAGVGGASATPGGAGALSGTAAGVGGASGTLTGAGALNGTAGGSGGTGGGGGGGTGGGQGGASGTLTGAGALVAVAAGVGGASATLSGSALIRADGVGGASATLTGAGALSGTAAGQGGASANFNPSANFPFILQISDSDQGDFAPYRLNSYKPGEAIVLSCRVYLDGELADPPGLAITVHAFDGTILTVGAVRDDIGVYHANLGILNIPGPWCHRWTTTGTSSGFGGFREKWFYVDLLDF